MAKFGKVGAAWKKKDKNGKMFIAITMVINGEPTYVSLFENLYKKDPKHPDYIANMDEDVASKANIKVEVFNKNASSGRVETENTAKVPEQEQVVAAAVKTDDGEPF